METEAPSFVVSPTRSGSDRPPWYRRAMTMSTVDDRELVVRIGARDADARSAEAELCRRYAPRIRLYGIRHLRDDDRAHDLVQIVLLGVLEAAREGRIDVPSRLERFVLGTCRNAASRLRDSAKRLVPLDHEPACVERTDPFERVDLSVLVACLDRLEDRAKAVVRMSFHDERASDEIAVALDLSVSNVRVVRHRAMHALRRCLDGHAEATS